MKIIDGKAIAAQIQEELKSSIHLTQGRRPCLAVILVGEHAPSLIYVNRKAQACESIGILSIQKRLPAAISEKELLSELEQLNKNPNVDGILVQLPLPEHINPMTVIHRIDPEKDVDGLHPLNAGKLLIGDNDGFTPCTPLGIKVLMERSGIEVSSKHVVVLGRSNLVGKPVAALLMQNAPGANATVTIGHSRSNNLKNLCHLADILIVAIGQPRFVTPDMIKQGAVVIDVGINKIQDPTLPNGYKLVGDVDFDKVKEKCSFITPAPGGVGPMTIAMLLSNTWKSYMRKF